MLNPNSNTQKQCSRCTLLKDRSHFYRSSQSKDGLRSWCKGCHDTTVKTNRSRVFPSVQQKAARSAYMELYKQRPDVKAANAKHKREKLCEYHMFQSARVRSREKGVAFDLTQSDIVVPLVCPLLGIPIIRGQGKGGLIPNSPSLDRKDPAKGYTKDNIWVISWRANKLKSDATANELRLIVAGLTAEGL